MSHELATRTDGAAAMAYIGKTPWHGLGERLLPGQSIEKWRKAAGMDYTVERAPVRYQTPHGVHSDPSKCVLYRSDNALPLGVASRRFNVVQPGEVLEFFSGLAEAAGLEMHTAGALFNGSRYWALARMRDELTLDLSADQVKPFLLLATACDGSMSTVGKWTSVRVVCKNTLAIAGAYDTSDTHATVRVSHRTKFSAEIVRAQLGVDTVAERWRAFSLSCQLLARAKVSNAFAEQFTRELFSGSTVAKLKEPKGFERVMALFNGEAKGADLESAKGTAWGLLNAVTQFADWEGRARSQDSRINSAFFGKMGNIKTEAMQRLLAVS